MQYMKLEYTSLQHWTALYCRTLQYMKLKYTSLQCTALHCTALHVIAMHGTVLFSLTMAIKHRGSVSAPGCSGHSNDQYPIVALTRLNDNLLFCHNALFLCVIGNDFFPYYLNLWYIFQIINRPGVAGAVLQIPPLLINWLINNPFLPNL